MLRVCRDDSVYRRDPKRNGALAIQQKPSLISDIRTKLVDISNTSSKCLSAQTQSTYDDNTASTPQSSTVIILEHDSDSVGQTSSYSMPMVQQKQSTKSRLKTPTMVHEGSNQPLIMHTKSW